MLSEVFMQLLSDVSKVIRNQSKFYYVGMSNFFIAPVAQYLFQNSKLQALLNWFKIVYGFDQAEQDYNWFLPRPARKELNAPNLNSLTV